MPNSHLRNVHDDEDAQEFKFSIPDVLVMGTGFTVFAAVTALNLFDRGWVDSVSEVLIRLLHS